MTVCVRVWCTEGLSNAFVSALNSQKNRLAALGDRTNRVASLRSAKHIALHAARAHGGKHPRAHPRAQPRVHAHQPLLPQHRELAGPPRQEAAARSLRCASPPSPPLPMRAAAVAPAPSRDSHRIYVEILL